MLLFNAAWWDSEVPDLGSNSAVSKSLWYATGDADEFSRSTFRGRLPLRYIYWRGYWTDTDGREAREGSLLV